MDHLLFAIYLVLFAWLVTKVPFFKKSGLSPAQLVIVFLMKVMAGIIYGWIGVYYGKLSQIVDTWYFHYRGIEEHTLLLNSPIYFFTSVFDNKYNNGLGNFLISRNSWWNDIKYISFEKLLGLFNVLSFSNYYTNIIFYSLLTLFGPIAIYKVMKDLFPKNPTLLFLAVFLVPSFLFWTSGLHKDGLIFLGLALIVYHFYFGFKEKHFTIRRWLYICFGVLLILMLRNFLIVVLMPALFVWFLIQQLSYKPIFIVAFSYLLFVITFFVTPYVYPNFNLPNAVVIRQQEFLELKGGSDVPVKKLEPTIYSFLEAFPKALSISTLRPFPTDVKHFLSFAAATETLLILVLFVVFLIWHKSTYDKTHFLLFCLCLSIPVLLMIGYTVNFLGAIVRYRSIVLPFLVVPLLALTDWERIKLRFCKHI